MPFTMTLYRSYPISSKLSAEPVPIDMAVFELNWVLKGLEMIISPKIPPRHAYILQINGPNIQVPPAIAFIVTGKA